MGFGKIPVRRGATLREVDVGAVGDPLERKADDAADKAMRLQRTGESAGRPAASNLARFGLRSNTANEAQTLVPEMLGSPGQPLDRSVRATMEPCFQYDFSRVRVHTDTAAAYSARAMNAQAYALGNDLVFGQQMYAPHLPEGRKLIAHELAHVVQQSATGPQCLRRTVEVRPPGRGEASAFDRRQELIDRMNSLSSGVAYKLNGQRIEYIVADAARITAFDRQMEGFIEKAEVAPLRLITSAGRVGARASGFSNLLVDFYNAGYLDLDDMKASDDNSFKMNLIHLLTERLDTKDYERRIGTNFSDAEFQRAHAAGLQAETQYLRDTIGDRTIRFVFEELKPDNTLEFGFGSREGYKIFHVFLRTTQAVSGGHVFVQTKDGRHISVEELIAERSSAVPALAP